MKYHPEKEKKKGEERTKKQQDFGNMKPQSDFSGKGFVNQLL